MTTFEQGSYTGSAYARVGLAGNPSDGYGGRVIAMTVPDFAVTARVTPAPQWSFSESELLAATAEALRSRRPELVDLPASLSFETTIPRQVGLAGSSAIVIATLRALAKAHGTTWEPVELARVALEVETQVLGWAAGPQDRVVQSIGGLVDMDFATPWHAESYQQLDLSLLPPLFLAWDVSTGQSSDVAHSTVRDRWAAGDPEVIAVMGRFAELGSYARQALDSANAAEVWPGLLNEAFALRSQIWPITDTDRSLVGVGESLGAGVGFAGSGGSVVGAISNPDHMTALARAYGSIGAGFVVLKS
jgi:glucuronokinase